MIEIFKSILRPIWQLPVVLEIRAEFFNLIEKMSGYNFEKKRFLKIMGYPLDLKNPKSFSQKIVWKKIYDRNPLLPIVADKYKVRSYIRDCLGKEKADKFLVPLLFASTDPETIPFVDLGEEYIIKANHNSGPPFIVEKGTLPDTKNIILSLKKQLREPYGIFKHEWAYGKIKKRMIIVEKLLRDENGKIPKDYKFHMIKGKCAFVQVDFDRFTDHSRSLYGRNWRFIKNTTLKFKQGPETAKPTNFESMLALAEELSHPFDYLRVDLYSIKDKIYIGEMTHYPGSGMEKITPQPFDFELGKYWN